MRMSDVPVGEMAFLYERMEDEVRETYYRRDSEATYIHYGCIQGDPTSEELPRYINISSEGFKYSLVKALPIKLIADSLWWTRFGAES